MKIECTIDGKMLTLSLNSNKPLSLVLQENLEYTTVNAHCRGKTCGLCAVLINGKATLSCLVPAFEIQGKTITTFDSFQKDKAMKDIEKAYESIGIKPCEDCYASRSILFESLISDGISRPDEIVREMSVLKCSCMDPSDEIKVVLKAIDIRRKRRVRRS